MANEKNLKPWKPGQSGNPRGRAIVSPKVRKAVDLSRDEFREVVSRFFNLTEDQLKAAVTDSKALAMEVMVGKVILETMARGDHMRLEWLCSRLWGRMPVATDSSDEPVSMHMQIIGMIEKLKTESAEEI